MGLSASQETVLDELVSNLPDSVTWCLFGSADSVLRGLDDDPNDIDILTTEPGAHEFRDVFSDAFVETRELGISQIDEYRMHGEELEVIFDLQEKDHQEPIVDLDAVAIETTAERGVPVLALETALEAYRRIDKHETADRLEAEFGLADG